MLLNEICQDTFIIHQLHLMTTPSQIDISVDVKMQATTCLAYNKTILFPVLLVHVILFSPISATGSHLFPFKKHTAPFSFRKCIIYQRTSVSKGVILEEQHTGSWCVYMGSNWVFGLSTRVCMVANGVMGTVPCQCVRHCVCMAYVCACDWLWPTLAG